MARTKRSILSILAIAGSVALALNRLRTDRPSNLDPLKPQGAVTTPSASVTRPGADATAPSDIPFPGWWQILKRTAAKFSENELMSQAASVTFFALLALFPAVTALVSIYGLFADPHTIQAHIESLGAMLPGGGMEIIHDQVERLTQNTASSLSVGAGIGLLASLWSSNQGTKAMLSALNAVYEEKEDRGFFQLLFTSLAFTLAGIVFLLMGIGSIVVVPIVFDMFGLQGMLDAVIGALRWPILLFALVLVLSVLYRYGPRRRLARWRWVTWGGAFSAIGWVVLSIGFSWYVSHFGSYNKTYGSLGAIIGFMTWIWLSCTVILVGAQLNAELEDQTARQTSEGPAKHV